MRKIININEGWKFTNGLQSETVNLPHTWNADAQKGYFRGMCSYEKYIEAIPEGRVMLEFEGVNSVCEAQINCINLGVHKGGYTAFRYDITDSARHDSVLTVNVSNSSLEDVYPETADFTFYGGIYRNVNLIVTGECRFSSSDYSSDGVYVTPFEKDGKWYLGIKALVDGAEPGAVISYKLKYPNGRVYASETVDISQSETYIDCRRPHLWNGRQDPYLYTLTAQIILPDGSVSDNLDIKVGFRSFAVDPEKGAFLNGKHVKLQGLCRHQDRAGIGNAITEKEHDEDMALILESGANALRLAHYPQAKYFYDLCDKNGVLVWAEIPVISRFSPKKQQNAKQQLLEMIKQNYNHPAIFCWGIENEITLAGKDSRELDAAVRELNALAKAVDTRRLTTCAQVSALPVSSSLSGITDILGYNHYFGWYADSCDAFGKWLDSWRAFNPEKKLCISEYGADAVYGLHSEKPRQGDYTEEYQCVFHEKYIKEINSRDWIWGSFVWNAFDFGSASRREGGTSGINNKGLVSYDRKRKKDAFYLYKALWSAEPTLHVCSSGFVNRRKGETVIKVYSNLSPVKLIYDGGELVSSGETVFEFTVPVKDGENVYTVSAGEESESLTVIGINGEDKSYSLPEGEGSYVRNWSSADDGENSFGLDDKIGDLLENEEAKAIIKARFGNKLDIAFSPLAKPVGAVKIGTAVNLAKRIGMPESFTSLAEGYIKTIKKK